MLGVLCGARDIVRERWNETTILGTTIRFALSHRCGTRDECNVMCGKSVCIWTCCVRGVTLHTISTFTPDKFNAVAADSFRTKIAGPSSDLTRTSVKPQANHIVLEFVTFVHNTGDTKSWTVHAHLPCALLGLLLLELLAPQAFSQVHPPRHLRELLPDLPLSSTSYRLPLWSIDINSRNSSLSVYGNSLWGLSLTLSYQAKRFFASVMRVSEAFLTRYAFPVPSVVACSGYVVNTTPHTVQFHSGSHAHAWLKFGSALTHSIHACVIWCVCLIPLSFFDNSIHFFFIFAVFFLISLSFFLPVKFIHQDMVDKYPAYFRWGPWHPGRDNEPPTSYEPNEYHISETAELFTQESIGENGSLKTLSTMTSPSALRSLHHWEDDASRRRACHSHGEGLSRNQWWIWSRDAVKGLPSRYLPLHQKARVKPDTKVKLLWVRKLRSTIRTGRHVVSSQHTDRFIVENDETNSYTEAESEMTLKSRSFLHRVNDQVRKRQKQSSKDATTDSDKLSVLWWMLMSSALQASVFLRNNYSDTWHSIQNTEDLTMKQMFDIINWEDSSWKHLPLVGDEQVISLSHKGLRIFRFCVMFWKDEREPTIKYCMGRQIVQIRHFTGPISQRESLQGVPVQVRKWISLVHWQQVNSSHRATGPTKCAMNWSIEETHEYIQWLVNAVDWTTAELVCFCRLSFLLSVSASLDCFSSDVRTLHWLKGWQKAQVHIHPALHAHVLSRCECCTWSLRLLHSLHLLPHHLSDHPAVPTARHFQLPGCGWQIRCTLPLRTLAPWPRITPPQVMSPTTTSSQRLCRIHPGVLERAAVPQWLRLR